MRNLIDLIEIAKNNTLDHVKIQQSIDPIDQWKAVITILTNIGPVTKSKIAQLEISNDAVVIPVIDRSGSMSGNPISQVRYSLKRLVDITYSNNNLITTVIAYDDRVETYTITTATPRSYYDHTFNSINVRGGTSFKTAFE